MAEPRCGWTRPITWMTRRLGSGVSPRSARAAGRDSGRLDTPVVGGRDLTSANPRWRASSARDADVGGTDQQPWGQVSANAIRRAARRARPRLVERDEPWVAIGLVRSESARIAKAIAGDMRTSADSGSYRGR
jgi:hypothetical protein